MGLRFFKRRNLLRKLIIYFLNKMLQWGCAFSSAEIRAYRTNRRWRRGFNGAALFQAQKSIIYWLKWNINQGFNGAALFQAQKFRLFWQNKYLLTNASMGLRFFKRRNHKMFRCSIYNQVAASMGLRFFKRRNTIN